MDNPVTGGAGFIGRHLVRLLPERGESVRVLEIDPGQGLPAAAEILRGSVTGPGAGPLGARGRRAM